MLMPSWPGPRPRDDIGRALVKQFQPDRAAEFTRTVGRTPERVTSMNWPVPRFVQYGSGQRHLRTR